MIAFVGGRGGEGWQIYTMADDGTGIARITEAFPREAVFFEPVWSPDGKSLVFTVKEHMLSAHSRVCTITIDRGDIHYLTPSEQVVFVGQWLQNGSIVYKERVIGPAKSDSYLCTVQGDGSNQRRVLHYSSYRGVSFSPNSFHSPTVSPDGTKIALISRDDDQLYIAYEGSPPMLLENEGLKIQGLAWAPDSSMLAFAAVRSRARVYRDLYVACDDGRGKQRVGRVLAESRFAWSSSGEQIAAIGSLKGILTINIIEVQSLKARVIAEVETDPDSGGPPDCPAWSPDGRTILYSTFAEPHVHISRAGIASGRTELLVGDEGLFRYVSGLSWH